jgi:hypothetical protein
MRNDDYLKHCILTVTLALDDDRDNAVPPRMTTRMTPPDFVSVVAFVSTSCHELLQLSSLMMNITMT